MDRYPDSFSVVELEPNYEAVSLGRRFVTTTAEQWRLTDVAADASLVASEIVSNAIIHARPPIELRLRRTEAGIRIEVRDGANSPISPAGPVVGEARSRGLGLQVVAKLSSRWGVDPVPDGKTVWAEIDSSCRDVLGTAEASLGPAPLPVPDDWPEVRLAGLPCRLLRSWEDHLRDLMREFALVAAGHLVSSPSGAEHLHEATPQLEEVVAELNLFWDLTRHIWEQANAPPGSARARISLTNRVPERLETEGPRFLRALDAADELARHGRLLSVPASPEVIGFGRWLVGAMVRQAAGGAAGPGGDRCPFPT